MRNGFYNPEQQMLTLKMLIDYLDNDKEAQAKVLYTTITKSGEHRFQLDETLVSILEESFIGRLEKQQFQDTYRDEPFLYHAKLLEVNYTYLSRLELKLLIIIDPATHCEG